MTFNNTLLECVHLLFDIANKNFVYIELIDTKKIKIGLYIIVLYLTMKFKKQFTFIAFILFVIIIWIVLLNQIAPTKTDLLAKFNRNFLNNYQTSRITEQTV